MVDTSLRVRLDKVIMRVLVRPPQESRLQTLSILGMRVVVLGAGFAGLELTSRLSEEFADDLDLVLVDRADGFVFGFSKLDVMFGRAPASYVVHPYAAITKPGARFVHATIRSIDPIAKRVETTAGDFDADILVVALGADLVPDETRGLLDVGHEFYTVSGAFALRDVVADFAGGRVVVGVTSTPFKCPPAPSETALLMHDFLATRGLRETSEIALVMPFGVPIPPSPSASKVLLSAFEERGITWMPDRLVRGLDATRRVAELSDGSELPFDLFLGVPIHRAPAVVLDSGMAVDGWIPVDPLTLETRFPGVYAVGDVTSVGTPKAGVFSEGQASVVADTITALIKGQRSTTTYDGRGVCYMEVGQGSVAKVDVTFRAGERPSGGLEGPSPEMAADKVAFGTSRVRRWFGLEWDGVSSSTR